MKPLPAGWKREKIRVLGKRSRAGGDYFRAGNKGQIRAVQLPLGDDWGLFTADDLGNALLYGKVMSGAADRLPLRYVWEDRLDDLRERINEVSGGPGYYCYVATIPRVNGDRHWWNILRCSPYEGTLAVAQKYDVTSPNVYFKYEEKIAGRAHGRPELIGWHRDGVYDLLVGTHDGKLLRYPQDRTTDRMGFSTEGEQICVGDLPIDEELNGWLCPCVVDWDGKGKSDLLVGTGDGYVMIYRDIGDEKGVAFSRGRRLVAEDGFVKVDGPASPTLYEEAGNRYLLVSDRDGVVWSWPLKEADSYVTDDFFEAFGGEASGISKTYKNGSWWLRTGEEGTLLCAAPESPVDVEAKYPDYVSHLDSLAPPLTLKPPQPGVYEIHLTLRTPEGAARPSICEARLSDEEHGDVLQGGAFHAGARQRVFFKAADLTGRELCIRQVQKAMEPEKGAAVYIESIQLIPVKRLRKVKRSAKPVISAILHTGAWTFDVKTDTPEEVDKMVEHHYRAGFDRIHMKLIGGPCQYVSRYPEAKSVVPTGDEVADPVIREKGQKYKDPLMHKLCEKMIEVVEKINRFTSGAQSCHRRGMQLFGWIRLQNHGEKWDHNPIDRFFLEHQHLMEKTRTGAVRQMKLCLAYPEVVDYYTRISEEAVEMGADGIMIDTLRHMPKVCYGDPVVKEFKERYGVDMRALPPADQRVVEMQCEVFARFIRAIRVAIRKKNPKAEIHVRVCKPHPLGGVWPERLAGEGLVDSFIIELRSPGPPGEPDIAGLVRELKGTSCVPCACFGRPNWKTSRFLLHDELIETKTKEFLAAGAREIAFYETGVVVKYPEFRRAIRRLKCPAEMPSRLP